MLLVCRSQTGARMKQENNTTSPVSHQTSNWEKNLSMQATAIYQSVESPTRNTWRNKPTPLVPSSPLQTNHLPPLICRAVWRRQTREHSTLLSKGVNTAPASSPCEWRLFEPVGSENTSTSYPTRRYFIQKLDRQNTNGLYGVRQRKSRTCKQTNTTNF